MNKLAQDELHGPIFMADVTDNKKLFGAVTFDKGAWVLYMEDFRAVCERLYGKGLEWFFAQWIYGGSRPPIA